MVRASGTSSSAAAEGVGARRSAAKSDSETSVSWPTADTTGVVQAAIARGQRFVDEGPEILQRAAAARQQQHVVAAAGISRLQHRADLGGGAFALHGHCQQLHFDQREAPAQHADDVADHRTGGRGQDRQPAHEGGQRSLARQLEQALRLQTRLEFLECPAQRPFAGFLNVSSTSW